MTCTDAVLGTRRIWPGRFGKATESRGAATVAPVSTNRPALEQADAVQAAWRRGQGPDADAVLFADGSLVVMDLVRFQETEKTTTGRFPPAVWQPVLHATAWTAGRWLDLDTYNHAARHGQHWAIAGEASAHGGIGWIALVTAPGEPALHRAPPPVHHTMHWLLISRYANPFSEIAIDDTEVRARNTLNECWTIRRDAPQHTRITWLAHDRPLT